MFKKIIFIIILFSVLMSCGKLKKNSINDDKSTNIMDSIILNTIYNIGIDPSLVQRTILGNEIHYSIPMNVIRDLLLADRFIQDLVQENGISSLNTLYDTHTTIQRSYWSAINNQVYVVDLFLIQARIGNIAQTELPRHERIYENQHETAFENNDQPTEMDNLVASLYTDTNNDSSFQTHNNFFESSSFTHFESGSGMPILCIIVDDFGAYDGPLLDAFAELDPAVTFAILPGLPFSQIAMRKAILSGREIIVHMPMEADTDDVSPGHNAILSHYSSGAIYDRVVEYFTELNFALGANNHMGSKITSNQNLMRSVFRYFSERGIFFIDSRTTNDTIAREIAREMRIPFAERDLFLDSPDNTDEIMWERLRDLERLRDTQGMALVITHCFDRGRLQRLRAFIEEAQKMGFVLVPVSVYVNEYGIRNYDI
ncbi:MAG: divergent polysaccharide deacetylase family protein [Candidatus Cloacimonetes bacterium]|nr:divergent polysaccharide deacetylase family protein [Candidatus Cloacimonadota bacterium]